MSFRQIVSADTGGGGGGGGGVPTAYTTTAAGSTAVSTTNAVMSFTEAGVYRFFVTPTRFSSVRFNQAAATSGFSNIAGGWYEWTSYEWTNSTNTLRSHSYAAWDSTNSRFNIVSRPAENTGFGTDTVNGRTWSGDTSGTTTITDTTSMFGTVSGTASAIPNLRRYGLWGQGSYMTGEFILTGALNIGFYNQIASASSPSSNPTFISINRIT